MLAFFFLEVFLNVYSARLQAAVVNAAPNFSDRWLNTAILTGVTVGPPLYGIAVVSSLEPHFLVGASLAIMLPATWVRYAMAQPTRPR